MGKKYLTALRAVLAGLLVLMLTAAFFACADPAPKPGGGDGETVSLNPAAKTIEKFEDFLIVPTQSGTGTLVWSSSDVSVATVASGRVMGLKAGRAVIKAAVQGTESSAECDVTVLDSQLVPALEFGLAEDSLALLEQDTFSLVPSLTYNGKTYTDAAYSYDSSADSVAEVSGEGVISAVSAGSAQVTVTAAWRGCTAETLSTEISVTVKAPVPVIEVELDTPADVDLSLDTPTFRLSDLDVSGETLTGAIDKIVDVTEEEGVEIGYAPDSCALTKGDLLLGERVWEIYSKDASDKNVVYRVNVTVATKVIRTGTEFLSLYTLGGGKPGAEGAEWGYLYAGYFVLGGNIDAEGLAVMESHSTDWVGDYSSFPDAGFQGVLDGRGFAVSNLKIGADGIFGMLGKKAVVKNVAFANVSTSSADHPAILAEKVYGGRVENVYLSVASACTNFWSAVMFAANDSVFKDIVIHAPGFVDENSNQWAGGGPLANMYGAADSVTVAAENVLVISNKTNSVHQDPETVPGVREFLDGISVYAPDTYKTDAGFLEKDFTKLYDCTAKGDWKVDSESLLPVFKSVGQPGHVTEETVSLNVAQMTVERYEDFLLTAVQSGTRDLVWSTSNAAVATVTGGKVLAVGAGSAVVTVQVSGQSSRAECTVTVTDSGLSPVLGFGLEDSALALETEQTKTLVPSLTYNGKTYTDADYSYVSSDDEIVTVGVDGFVTAVKSGSAQITVTAAWRGCTAEALTVILDVTVTDRVIPKLELALNSPADVDLSLSDGELDFDLAALDVKGTAPTGTALGILDVTNAQSPKAVGFDGQTKLLTRADLVLGERLWEISTKDFIYKLKVTVATKVIKTGAELSSIYALGAKHPGHDADWGYPYDGYFVLGKSFDAAGTAMISYSSGWAGTTYVSYPDSGFLGTFDGRGHSVSNLKVGTSGIFGMLGGTAVVKNVAFTGVTTDLSADGTSILAMQCYGGRIENVYVSVPDSCSNFWSTVMFAANGSVMKDLVVIARTINVNTVSPLIHMIGEWANVSVTLENVLVLSDKAHIQNGFQPAAGETFAGMSLYAPDTYKTDEGFLAKDFTKLYDCTETGVWKVDGESLLPVFKKSV